MVMEPPSDRSELIWAQQEIRLDELGKYAKAKDELSVFNVPGASQHSTGWYICKLVLVEVHDTGTHGDTLLMWIDSHLIKAIDADSAYRSATDLGKTQASESGTHRCNGDMAHWEFKGLRDLVEALSPPCDGAILWIEKFAASSGELRKLIPARPDLGVFAWESRQGRSRA